MSHPSAPLAPIGSKPRHFSGNTLLGGSSDTLGLSGSLGGSVSGLSIGGLNSYHKAPGSEREDRETSFKKQLAAIDSNQTLDPQEKNKRKQSLFLANMIPSHPPAVSLPITLPVSMPVTPSSSFVSSLPSSLSSTVSPLAPPFYPTSDTVESVVGEYCHLCFRFVGEYCHLCFRYVFAKYCHLCYRFACLLK